VTALDTAKAVLAKASLLDQTFAKPDLGIAVAWAEALGDMDQADACEAVTQHYRAENSRLMPKDVITGVRRIRSNRLAELAEEVPDADPNDVAAYLAALREQRYRAASGEAARPVAALVAAVASRKSIKGEA
jgi:hypothetical protein